MNAKQRASADRLLAAGKAIPSLRIVTREELRAGDPYKAIKALWNMGYRGQGLNLAIPSDRLPVGALHR